LQADVAGAVAVGGDGKVGGAVAAADTDLDFCTSAVVGVDVQGGGAAGTADLDAVGADVLPLPLVTLPRVDGQQGCDVDRVANGEVGQGVDAVAAGGKADDVVACPCGDEVVAGAAGQGVGAAVAKEAVVAGATVQASALLVPSMRSAKAEPMTFSKLYRVSVPSAPVAWLPQRKTVTAPVAPA
jgi:hypothetical protein